MVGKSWHIHLSQLTSHHRFITILPVEKRVSTSSTPLKFIANLVNCLHMPHEQSPPSLRAGRTSARPKSRTRHIRRQNGAFCVLNVKQRSRVWRNTTHSQKTIIANVRYHASDTIYDIQPIASTASQHCLCSDMAHQVSPTLHHSPASTIQTAHLMRTHHIAFLRASPLVLSSIFHTRN